jgi:hypothetical protein
VGIFIGCSPNGILEYIKDLFNSFKKNLERRGVFPERISNNIAVMLTGVSIYRKLALDLEIHVEDILFDDLIDGQIEHLMGRDAAGSLDRLLKHTSTMTKESTSLPAKTI